MYRLFLLLLSAKVCKFDGVTIPNYIQFPYGNPSGPFMGLFLALAIPLQLPKQNVFVSYNFEGNYNLPTNQTSFSYPPVVSGRSFSLTRRMAYDAIEFKLNSHGYSGKNCLLRTICEAAEHSLEHNGVLGDILHILLTPSTSLNEGLVSEYQKAEIYGRTKRNCKRYVVKCSISLLGLVSWLGNISE